MAHMKLIDIIVNRWDTHYRNHQNVHAWTCHTVYKKRLFYIPPSSGKHNVYTVLIQQLTLQLSDRFSRWMVLVTAILHKASDKCRTDSVDKLQFFRLSCSMVLQ